MAYHMVDSGRETSQIARVPVSIPWGTGTAHIYALGTAAGIVLIDSGHESDVAWAELKQGLEAMGWHAKDVCAILLTHSHADHSGLCHILREDYGAKVYVHKAERDSVEKRRGLWEGMLRCTATLLAEHGMPLELVDRHIRERESQSRQRESDRPSRSPDVTAMSDVKREPLRTLEDGEVIDFGNLRLVALHCPGHSPGSMVYWHAGSGTLFSGDHILQRVPTKPIYFLNGNYEERTRSLSDYLSSLAKVAALPIRRILPGHGEDIEDAGSVVMGLRRHHTRRLERVLSAMGAGPSSAFDLLPKVFPHLPSAHVILGAVEVICHIDVLVDAGRVVEEKRDRLYYYRVADRR